MFVSVNHSRPSLLFADKLPTRVVPLTELNSNGSVLKDWIHAFKALTQIGSHISQILKLVESIVATGALLRSFFRQRDLIGYYNG
jgi:hypothetical protein